MKKRGQIELAGAVIVLVVVAYAGFFLIQERSIMSITGNVITELPPYVGNTETNKVCLIINENLEKIPINKRVFFNSLEEANKLGFKYLENCV